jgi:hypothetical protein
VIICVSLCRGGVFFPLIFYIVIIYIIGGLNFIDKS